MTDRYAVRRTESGHGVWDAAVNGWHGRQDLDESEATRLADQLNSAGTTSPRPADQATPGGRPRPARPVEPPKRVLVRLDDGWSSGRLDRWVRQPDGWYGRVQLDLGGPATWYSAAVLRPAAAEPT